MANHLGPAPSWLTAEYLHERLAEPLGKPDMEITSMEVVPASKVGDNYSCQVFRIHIEYTADDEETSLSLIGKYQKPTKLMDSVGSQFFKTEVAFYNIFLPKIRQDPNRTDSIVPKGYFIDEENQIIFMEDLGASGFVLQERGVLLNLEQCYLVIDAIAVLHGSSFYIIEENPNLRDIFNVSMWGSEINPAVKAMFDNAEIALQNNIDEYGLSEEHQSMLLGIFEKVRQTGFKVCECNENKINFLLHGDCWKSNVMFHYNEEGVDAVKLVDFQIINFNSFANDLHYCLFTGVDAETLLDNLDNILQRYYEKLMQVAPDIPGVVTLERIKEEFEERYFFGLAVAIIFRGSMFYSEVPIDIEKTLDGVHTDMGYGDERFINDIQLFVPFFEKVGVL